MPRFPHVEQLSLPGTFTRYIPGRPHPDGRRYLPLLIFEVAPGLELGVVDRHHLVDQALVGTRGTVAIVFLLSTLTLQSAGEERQGLEPEMLLRGQVSTAPRAYGRVVSVPSWEEQRGTLSYESLYTEVLLDVGLGIVGVRTALTAADLTTALGKPQLAPGDWLVVGQSRIDILTFRPEQPVVSQGAAQ